jgi:hypothetical protein
MLKVFESEGPLFLPSREDPAINQLFADALPCPACEADQRNLWPLMSAEAEGIFAVGCSACNYIGDDGVSIAKAITKWNTDEQRERSK